MPTAQSLNSSLFVADDAIQTKVNLFIKDLQQLGFSNEEIEKITSSTMENLENELAVRILATMDEEDSKKWEAFIATKPNSAQEFMIMDKFLKNKVGKGIEELQDEILITLIDNTLESLKLSKDASLNISQLTDEEVTQAQSLLDQGKFEDAQKIINKMNNPQ